MLSERGQSQKHIWHVSIYVKYSEKASLQGQKQISGCEAGGREKWGMTAIGYRVSFGSYENILKIDNCEDWTTLGIY